MLKSLVTLMLVSVLSLAACTTSSAAPEQLDDENPHLWQPRTRSVAVFKNGLGFFMREGEVEVRDGWCVGRHIPPAAFGTLAIFAHDEKEMVDIVGSGPGEIVEFDDRDAPSDLATKRRRLQASRHLKMQLHYTYKNQERTAAGTLVSVGPEFVALDDGQNSYAVRIADVTKMQSLELPLRVHVLSEEEKRVEKTKLGMAYLRKGITWIPEYSLQVLDDGTAELTLRGTLVNEAEDLIHTDVHLVVGVPHFVHTQYMAPIAVGQMIRSIGTSVAPAALRGQIMNRAAIVRNNIVANGGAQLQPGVVEQPVAPAGGDLAKALGNLPQMGGAAASDYTVYTKKDLTLRRGEKAILTLFKRKIRYSHIYRWTPPGRMQHSLVLHNQTDTAWTTGPCLALSEQRPLSEDLLKYTPSGGNAELPVTAAINIAHEKTESEVQRKLKSYHVTGSVYFDVVTIEGELELKNFEKETIQLVVSNPVPGKPLAAESGGRAVADPTQLKIDQRRGTVSWRVELKPGEEKSLKYSYERYVRSH